MKALQLPRLGQTMERGRVVRWLKQVGDPVAVGEPLYEIESEKAVVEVEATMAGCLVHITVPEEEEVDVGTVMGVLAEQGESPDGDAVARFLAGAGGVVREVKEEEKGEERTPARPRVLPRARARARELGVDLDSLMGTLPDGSIGVGDVERAQAAGQGPRLKESVRLAGTVLAMAEAVARGWREVPQFVQIAEFDLSGLESRARSGTSVTDLVLRAIARAAAAVPLANSRYREGTVEIFEDVNIALAVATERGLVAPVLRRVQELELPEISSRRAELVQKAREGRLRASDLAGGTISFSNLGKQRVETGTPLVVEGQSMIVFMGSMEKRPVVRDGKLAVATTAYFSLGCDHRVLDGATAAAYLSGLRDELEGVR
jgi:pyruvate dehydrogenase E2 component (dihydrolipoamide acetyltransferase)